MSKRAPGFERIPRDLYRTFDPRAGQALHPFLEPHCRFVEPCAGEGDLIRQLEALGHECIGASDIQPLAPGIQKGDALKLRRLPFDSIIITNPPWRRVWLHQLIKHFLTLGESWLLFDADWMHTQQAGPLMHHCRRIVSVGRLLWIPGTSDDGKDNIAWYNFSRHEGPPTFFGRQA